MGLTPLAVHVFIFQKENCQLSVLKQCCFMCHSFRLRLSHSQLWDLADVVTSFQFLKTFTYLRRYIKSTSQIHLEIRFNLS